MPKNIVLLSDGTGNSAAKLSKTNAWRLYQALDLSDSSRQIAFYDDGVGTSSFKPAALLGGAFGYGVKRNILDLYTFLCRNYETADRIFCFGFSRGAFTVRALTGLIACEGLVADPSEAGLLRKAKTAYREYRRERFPAAIPVDRLGRALRDLFVGDRHYAAERFAYAKPDIAFLGVWDTVAAYGLPIDELTRALNWVWRLYPKDREAHKKVRRVCHAVALDDERNTFHPMLFNEEREPGRNEQTAHLSQERISQVWFAGMHSNVGGGYPDDGLAHVSLQWMIEQAGAAGLSLKTKERQEISAAANPFGTIHDSRRGAGGFYRYLPRKMALLTNETADRSGHVVAPRPKIHESVFQRIRSGVDRYAPIGLPARYAVVRRNGDIVDCGQFLEHPDQAASRVNRQERIYNLVWYKRVAYFSSIAGAALLAAFPLYRHQTVACEGAFCFVSPAIGWIGAFLPGFLDPWLAAYRSQPGSFLALATAFALLLTAGTRLQGRIFDNMRVIWREVCATPGTPVPIAPLPPGLLYKFRTHPLYQWFFRLMKRHILPAVFGVAFLAVLAGTGSRLVFKVWSSAGFVCSAPDSYGESVFPAKSVCWAAGPQELEAGRNYRITLSIDPAEPYSDASVAAGLGGFGGEKMPWIHPAALFFRRHLREPWFRPFARIGEQGSDEYVLNPSDGSQAGEHTREMTAVITARRKGRLYLFLNDAVLPVPNNWQYFYGNNHGRIKVSVEPAAP